MHSLNSFEKNDEKINQSIAIIHDSDAQNESEMIEVIMHKSQTFEAKNECKQKQKLTSPIGEFIVLMLSIIAICYSLQIFSSHDVIAHLRGIKGEEYAGCIHWENGIMDGRSFNKGRQADWAYEGTAQKSKDTTHGVWVIQGTGTWKNGDKNYVGDWFVRCEADVKWMRGKSPTEQGTGTFTSSDGVVTGNWMDNDEHGYCVTQWYDPNESHKGNWFLGQKQGQGTHTYVDGDTYEGNWVDNKRHGRGIYTHVATGRTYEGWWKADKKDGHGVKKYPDGGKKTKYIGWWKNGQRHEHGEQTYDNGDMYKGEWKDGVRHGKGMFTKASKRIIYDGMWLNNKPHGYGQLFAWSSVHDTPEMWSKGVRLWSGTWKNDIQPSFDEEVSNTRG